MLVMGGCAIATTCEQYGASPGASATTNTLAIQTALNNTGVVTLNTAGTYQINSALLVPSNTEFDIDSTVILQLATASNTNMLRNSGNSNITISGGTWNYGGTNQNPSDPHNLHTLVFNQVSGLTLKNITIQNVLKYCVLVANSSNIVTTDIVFNSTSDGLHFHGPINNAYIHNISGHTGDDMIAFTEGDYATYELSRGNISNVIVDGEYPANSTTALAFVGSYPYTFSNISVKNINGYVSTNGIRLISDINLVGLNINDLTIDNINLGLGSSYSIIYSNTYTGTSKNNITNLRVSNVTLNGTSTSKFMFYNVTVQNFYLNDSILPMSSTQNLVYFYNTSTCQKTFLNNISVDNAYSVVIDQANSITNLYLYGVNVSNTSLPYIISSSTNISVLSPYKHVSTGNVLWYKWLNDVGNSIYDSAVGIFDGSNSGD